MNIYCFPYAGGSSFIYSKLRRKSQENIKFVSMEYPGHGVRMGESLSDSVDFILDDMYKQIQKKDDGSSFALLGYSLGSKLIYLLLQKYKNTTIFRRLKCIFFCAMTMSDSLDLKDYSKMSDKELMDYTISLGGSDFQDEEEYKGFLEFLPIIRNDFVLFEKSKKMITNLKTETIDKQVFVIYSSDEDNINSYEQYVARVSDYKYFDNGHFFINYHAEEMADYVRNCIKD
jgi:medium-chain acyl-[acyl-carrier-protein] hydrolase